MKKSKYLRCGPGGRRCICCFPAPGSKERKAKYRKAKRAEKKDHLKTFDWLKNVDKDDPMWDFE